MATLLNIALMNAVTVLLLAVLAVLVSRLARKPALTHALWVLVLLKFVTPPLFNLPVTIETPLAAEASIASLGPSALAQLSTPQDAAQLDRPSVEVRQSVSSTAARSQNPPHAENRQSARPITDSPHVTSDSASATASPGVSRLATAKNALVAAWVYRPELPSLLLACWLAGIVFWLAMQSVRAVRFQRRVLRDAIAPAALQEQTRQLAARLGLKRVPQVLIVEAAVSPMLWGCGSRTRLLFPLDLAERLDDNARATLLTHELAHYSRGDHWVRLLELVATGLFWWHPVVWWARRQIEESEEECCDAWVVDQFPHAPRQYAEALLDTIDFLCESRRALPPLASGLGQAHFLRRRLTQIMRGASPKTLTPRVRWTLALVAVLLLPLQPFVFGSASIADLRLASSEQPLSDAATALPSASAASNSTGVPMLLENPADKTPSVETSPPTAPNASRPARMRMPGERVWSTAVSPNGRFVVRTTTARRVLLTDLSANRETDLSEHGITAVAFAPDGEWFAAAGQDGRITIWDAARGELLRTLLTHGDVLRSVAISPQGNAIAASGRDGMVMLIDLITGDSPASMPSFASAVNCVRFSPDGRQLAVAVGDWMSNRRGQVALLDTSTGETVATLGCATSPGALTFASNDELIVGLWDGRTQLWNLAKGQVVGSALADKSVVSAAAFSPDNPVLREATFVATEPVVQDDLSPLSLLQSLFAPSKSPLK